MLKRISSTQDIRVKLILVREHKVPVRRIQKGCSVVLHLAEVSPGRLGSIGDCVCLEVSCHYSVVSWWTDTGKSPGVSAAFFREHLMVLAPASWVQGSAL